MGGPASAQLRRTLDLLKKRQKQIVRDHGREVYVQKIQEYEQKLQAALKQEGSDGAK